MALRRRTRRRGGSPWRGPALFALALAASALAGLWTWRTDIAGWGAERLLEAAGFGPARVAVARLGLDGLEARDISLRNGALRIAALTLAYTPTRLAEAHLDRAHVTGLRLTLIERADGLTLGGRPLAVAEPGGETPPLAHARIDALRLSDARLALEGLAGRYEATLALEGAVRGARLSEGAFEAALSLPVAGRPRAVRLAAREVSAAARGDGLVLSFIEGTVVPADEPWSLDGLAAELAWRPGRASATIEAGRLVDARRPPLAHPVDFSGKAAFAERRIDYALGVELSAPVTERRITVGAEGRHDLASGNGQAEIAMAPFVFAPGGPQPADFFPALAQGLAPVGGTLSVAGPIRWRGGRLSTDLLVRLAGGTVEAGGARFTDVAGAVRLTGLSPLSTPPGQSLAGTVSVGGLPPAAGSIRFALSPSASLAVERVDLAFADGRIVASPFVIDPAALAAETVLQVEALDLSVLLGLVGVEGLSGTGRIAGRIPLSVSDGRVRVGDAQLAASGPGVLRFKSDALPAELTQAGEEMRLALQALEDFHYDTLSLELTQGAGGEGAALLRLGGANPAVLEGRRFNLNIRLESNFDRLTDLALRSMSAAQNLLRRAGEGVTP